MNRECSNFCIPFKVVCTPKSQRYTYVIERSLSGHDGFQLRAWISDSVIELERVLSAVGKDVVSGLKRSGEIASLSYEHSLRVRKIWMKTVAAFQIYLYRNSRTLMSISRFSRIFIQLKVRHQHWFLVLRFCHLNTRWRHSLKISRRSSGFFYWFQRSFWYLLRAKLINWLVLTEVRGWRLLPVLSFEIENLRVCLHNYIFGVVLVLE